MFLRHLTELEQFGRERGGTAAEKRASVKVFVERQRDTSSRDSLAKETIRSASLLQNVLKPIYRPDSKKLLPTEWLSPLSGRALCKFFQNLIRDPLIIVIRTSRSCGV